MNERQPLGMTEEESNDRHVSGFSLPTDSF
jgi:hypothetical protein